MGRILKRRGWARDTFVVSSKVFWGGDLPNQEGLSRKHAFEAWPVRFFVNVAGVTLRSPEERATSAPGVRFPPVVYRAFLRNVAQELRKNRPINAAKYVIRSFVSAAREKGNSPAREISLCENAGASFTPAPRRDAAVAIISSY